MPPKETKKTAEDAAHQPEDGTTIREGKAIVSRPPKEQQEEHAATAAASSKKPKEEGEEEEDIEGQKVFYNPVQVFNRDLSILMIQTFVEERRAEYGVRVEKQKAKVAAQQQKIDEAKAAGKPEPNYPPAFLIPEKFPGITILEALSATGLRSIRYFKEIEGVEQIIVNDMDAEAVKSIEYNIKLNGLTTQQLVPSHNDAITLMQKYRPPPVGPITVPRPTVIDLDPYGTATPFLDSAVQAIDEGGLLAITCTDKSILCGNYSETCWAKYGSMPLKGTFCHETAIRIVLNSINSAANRYGRHIVPLLSMSIDFYVRVFVRVYSSPIIVKKQASITGMMLECVGCQSFWPHAMGRIKEEGKAFKHTPNVVDAPLGPGAKCPECDSTIKMGGPFWLGPLHNKTFIGKALSYVQKNQDKFATSPRIIGSLTLTSEELQDAEEAKMDDKSSYKQKQKDIAASSAAAATAATAASSSTPAAATPASSSNNNNNHHEKKGEHLNSMLYYSLPHIFQVVNGSCPKISLIRSAILNAGYKVSQSHCLHSALKTNAPPHVVWDIVRCWTRDNPPKNGQKKGSPGEKLMQKPITTEANFTLVKGTDLSSNATGVAKFLPNPEENWGPKARAGSKRKGNSMDEQVKRARLNQNKRSRARQCKAFAEGEANCKFGVTCKYAHVPGAKAGEDVSARVSESLSGHAAMIRAGLKKETDAEDDDTAASPEDADVNMEDKN